MTTADPAEAIAALLRPRAIAIVGASDNSRWSRAAFDNLKRGGFAGDIHLVNRRGGTVHGQPALQRCEDLPRGVDLGVLLVPAHAAEAAVRDLASAGVRAVLILSSGFAETGGAGVELQRKLGEVARRHGVRLLGPNTLGFINFVDRTVVWTTPITPPHAAAGVAIVSQSGATAYFLSDLAARQGVGLSYVVATGNEVDLDCSSFIDLFVSDPSTKAIAVFIETVRDPPRFMQAAERALIAGKPVVVLKVGASEAIAKSAIAHTGALVGDDRIFDGVCRQLGLIRVRSIEDLLTTADVVSKTGILQPGGLCIVSNSGGICEIAGDTADLRGMTLPDVSPQAADALRATIPDFATPHNPLDLTGGITPEQCGTAVRVMGGQDGVAAILCPWYPVPTSDDQVNDRLIETYGHLAAALRETAAPGFLVSYTATAVNELSREIIARSGLPYLACGLDRAISGLAGAFWWSDRRRNFAGPRTIDGQGRHAQSAPRPVSERETLEHLARHGVPIVPAAIAGNAEEAVAIARGIEGAVVLKIASPDIAHKSDIGGVALDVVGDAAVREAYLRIVDAARGHHHDAHIDGVLVSPMRERGIELFVGIARDAQWGPVLTVGLGGIWVEVLKDVSLRLLPVGPGEVRRMLAELRGAEMLSGRRGVPPADLDAVADVVARIGDAALDLGADLAAMDVNPLWVRGDRIEALDALAVWDHAPA